MTSSFELKDPPEAAIFEVINIAIRSPEAKDKNLIMATWLKGNYYGSPLFGLMPQALYFEEYAKFIYQILNTPGVEIRIACDQGNPHWVVGFAVFRGPDLYWVYVKRDFRRRGIAALLLKDKGIKNVKSLTRIGRTIAEQKRLIFNPL